MGREEGLRASKGDGWRCGSREPWFVLTAGEGLWARQRRGAPGRTGRGSFPACASVFGLCSGAADRRAGGRAGGCFGAGGAAGRRKRRSPRCSLPPSSGTGSFQPAKSPIYKVSRPSSWKYLRLVYNGCNSLLIYPAPSLPPPVLFFFFFFVLSPSPASRDDLCALFPTRKLLFGGGNAWGGGREESEQRRG